MSSVCNRAWLSAALIAGLLTIPVHAAAQPIPCTGVTDVAHRSAIAAAEAWLGARWLKAGNVWSTTYTLKPSPRLPLGIGTFGRGMPTPGEPLTPPPAAAARPIAGLAEITALTCTSYEINPAGAYAVRFAGRALRFNENGSGWTRPVLSAVIHVVEVHAVPLGDVAAVSDLPEARTALPPDVVFLRPLPPLSPQPLVSKRP